MDAQPQCPGEPYTLTVLLCRGRQAKGYEKCPSCAHRERVNAMPEAPVAAAPAPVHAAPVPAGEFGRELEAAQAPAPRLRLPKIPNAAAGIGLGAAALHQSGFGGLLKRIYHYF